MKNKNLIFGMFFLVGILFMSFVCATSYSKSNPNYGAFNSYVQDTAISDRERCEAGQDFIIQISPYGCEPSVVRSDLLEEQNIPVFCQLAATKINPLIDVNAIESISFSGDYPKDVSGISFHPARAALGTSGDLNSPILDNIGYVVVVLRQNKNESSMPETVAGNLTARISYDIKNAFGIGRASFYLPELTDSDFEDKKTQFSFWNGKGYLRAESVDEGSATISIYNDLRRVSTTTLEKGESSGKINLPDLDCLANLQLKLDGLEAPNTRARFEINGNPIEVTEREYFLDNNCRVTDLEKKGVVEDVSIKCKTDDGIDTFSLRVSPKVNLSFEGSDSEGYLVGQKMPFGNESNNFYLAYIGTEHDSGREEDLYVRFMSVPKDKYSKDFLDDRMLEEVARYNDGKWGDKGSLIRRLAGKVLEATSEIVERFARYLVKGTKISETLEYAKRTDIYGTKVALTGFAGSHDRNLAGDIKTNYENAMKDYDRVLDNYPKEPCGDITCGEEALYKKIVLAFNSEQRLTALKLCEEFKSGYPNSEKNLKKYCDDKLRLANTGLSSHDVVVNNVVKMISFEGIVEPTIEEYSADITILNADKDCTGAVLRKDGQACFSNTEFITLKELHSDYALFDVSSVDEGDLKNTVLKTSYLRIDLKDTKVIGKNNYQIRLNDVSLKNVAKVSVLPNVDNAGTVANFSFKIGIEKRAIQLSPEETRNRIDNLNKTITDWQDKSENLGRVVKGLKGACLATGAYLTVKNFFANVGGKGIARSEIMRGAGGWNEKCSGLVGQKKYSSIEECIFSNSDNIDSEVDSYYNSLQKQNDEIKGLENSCPKTEFLTEVNIDTNCFKDKFAPEVKSELAKNIDPNKKIKIGTENVSVSKILEGIDSDSVSIEELRRMQLNSRIDSDMARAQLEADLRDVYIDTKDQAEKKSFSENAVGVRNPDVDSFGSKDSVSGIYRGGESTSDNPVLNEGTPVKMITFNGKKYYLELEKTKGSEYRVANIYDSSWTRLTSNEEESKQNYDVEYDSNVKEITKTISVFKKYDSASYENAFKSVSGETSVVVKFYETDPYKGLPALVPFDLDKGWYAATKQTLPVAGGIQAYDESGRVTSLWVCNVGENVIAEFKSGIGDDECRQVNLGTGATYSAFPYLDPGKAIEIVRCAIDAIEDASNYKSGGNVRISTSCGGSHSIKVGSPAVDIPEMQCTDYMSPDECKLLFNVCDPVICPSSRCDLGGAYPVKDVIQSGIIGSIALCLPNYKEGIYVPVCLTGIKAGIDGYLSVVKAHRDCLQESLDSGETVGICDEIYSINLCEFFWRQGLPLAKLALPKLIEALLGQNVHGGGEYLGIADAWSQAESSVTYFTQYYAANSFEAFKARTAEEVGGEVCRNFASGVVPSGGDLLNSLTEPDSPAQYHGRFDEILFSTATVPSISQYKVFYHIYAGDDQGAYYQVYLTEGSDSSFYQDTSYRRIVDSGYIKKGDYADETKDFTAPSGYKKLCIRVNDEEDCGFKQVSTSYAVNYVEDKYLEEQASQTDIKKESECISGTSSLYSFASPNLQEGANEFVDPSIYNRGIIRICSTENPGKGTDEARWSEVGYCDDEKIRCWIDRESVRDVIKDKNIENSTLNVLENSSVAALEKSGVYENKDFIDGKIKEKETLMKEGKYTEVIKLVDGLIDKVYWNYQKVKLLFNRGDAYAQLVSVPSLEVTDKKTTTIDSGTSSTTGNSVCEKTKCGVTTGSSSVTETQYIMGGSSCLANVAKSVVDEANKVKDSLIKSDSGKYYFLEDDEIAKQAEVASFGCLVAMVARQEGCMAHCKYKEGETDPLYCEEGVDRSLVIEGDNGDAIGVMQISIKNHGNSFYAFDANVKKASELLIEQYNPEKGIYRCHFNEGTCGSLSFSKTYEDNCFENIIYNGWERALRHYNGWNSLCLKESKVVGNPLYVEHVLSKKNEIIKLVPECKVGLLENEITNVQGTDELA